MTEGPLVSVIIPVWRDEGALATALQSLPPSSFAEVIVATVLGEDSRYRSLRDRHPGIRWISAPRGRAVQMNAGASIARGRWLLFLHADSRLPREWPDVITRIDAAADVAAGAFRLTLDSGDWRARVIEMGVRLRVRLLGLPYGDQGLFIRHRVFDRMGGYRDLPLMEDIDLARRLRVAGRLYRSGAAVVTSARRWERDGWVRRSVQNVVLATRFLLGASPAQLAQRYFGRSGVALVMMARAPWTAGKTRLDVTSDQQAHEDLRQALFLDTLEILGSVRHVDRVVACEPADACERMRELVGSGVDVVPQRGADLGERLRNVFEDVFRLGAESVLVIGSDLPDLPAGRLQDAVRALRRRQHDVVLGPAADGGYYLIGMTRPTPRLFEGIDWGSDRVFAQTLGAARSQGLSTSLLEQWMDLDNAADLDRVLKSASGAVRTRAWCMKHTKASLS